MDERGTIAYKKTILVFVFRGGYLNLLVFSIILVLAWLIISVKGEGWWNVVEPVLAFGTLGVALFIWWNEKRREYEENLPKKLSVSFVYVGPENRFKDKEVICCKDVYLAGEGDIRAWGQQIGRQVVDNINLSFTPDLRPKPSEIKKGNDGGYFKSYSVTFFLTELPNKVKEADPQSLPLKCARG